MPLPSPNRSPRPRHPSRAESDPLPPWQSIRKLGLSTARSQQQLEELVTASTKAIVIDRSMAGDLSPDFLARPLARGVYVFGLNLSERELKTMADWGKAYEMVTGRLPFTGRTSES